MSQSSLPLLGEPLWSVCSVNDIRGHFRHQTHLAELEARGLHRTRACSSLYTYLIYELRFSEDAAARRSAAAKLARRFPAILGAVATGEIHLTGLLMLGPHLTEDNHVEVLSRAKFRTKKGDRKLAASSGAASGRAGSRGAARAGAFGNAARSDLG